MQSQIRIMHLVQRLNASGMENGVINICNNLDRGLFRPSVCTYEPEGTAEHRLDRSCVDIMCTRRYCGNDISLPIRLARVLSQRKIDILHTHNWVTLMEGLVAAKIARVPVVIHGEHGHVRDRRRQIFAQRWAWRRVDRLLAVSDALADRMAGVVTFPRTNITVIPNGVDASKFIPKSSVTKDLRQKFGLPESAFVVGMVARFAGFKNHAGALRAIQLLKQRGSNAHIAMAGTGELEQELRRLAGSLQVTDRVHMVGEVADIVPFLHCIDALLSNSTHNEGMSNSILEAMACEIAVIATRVAASSTVIENGVTGILIPPGDDTEVVNAISLLQDSPDCRTQLGQAARQCIVARFSVESMVQAYAKIYESLFALKRPSRAQRKSLSAS